MLGPFLETLIDGLMIGVLYSLVALGFVLIFKASGVFNYAQGVLALFAALTSRGWSARSTARKCISPTSWWRRRSWASPWR